MCDHSWERTGELDSVAPFFVQVMSILVVRVISELCTIQRSLFDKAPLKFSPCFPVVPNYQSQIMALAANWGEVAEDHSLCVCIRPYPTVLHEQSREKNFLQTSQCHSHLSLLCPCLLGQVRRSAAPERPLFFPQAVSRGEPPALSCSTALQCYRL